MKNDKYNICFKKINKYKSLSTRTTSFWDKEINSISYPVNTTTETTLSKENLSIPVNKKENYSDKNKNKLNKSLM